MALWVGCVGTWAPSGTGSRGQRFPAAPGPGASCRGPWVSGKPSSGAEARGQSEGPHPAGRAAGGLVLLGGESP